MSNLETILTQQQEVKVIEASICISEYTAIDLSVSNTDLSNWDIKDSELFENYIEKYLQKKQSKIAFGGYNEERNLYNNNHLFTNSQSYPRNIHIGLDLWGKAKTPVLAALEGSIHSFANNIGNGNYGPTILLKHQLDNQTFYTLYGHLSLESIQNLEVGIKVKKGDPIAQLGDSRINGGYCPHLHFQIIKNIGANFGDYPGVCSKKELEYYLANCPNPNLLLQLK
jgi:murein DD-endopeptidase MepM/ murein hydrolase activator NlpD